MKLKVKFLGRSDNILTIYQILRLITGFQWTTPFPDYLKGQDAAVKEGSEGAEAEAEHEGGNRGREGETPCQPEGIAPGSRTKYRKIMRVIDRYNTFGFVFLSYRQKM